MLSKVFERVYVINLKRRTDRWNDFISHLPENWPLKIPVRYDAVDGGVIPPPTWWQGGKGAWGCYKTHLQIIEECLRDQIQTVLIIEDDALFTENFAQKLEEFWRFLPDDWEMVYLGGQHLEENTRVPRKINEWTYQPYNINRTHCYGLRGTNIMTQMYQHLHDFSSWKVAHHIDHYLGELHKKMEHGLYVPREWLVFQMANTSDVCNSAVEERRFQGAEELSHPVIDLPGAAVLGSYFSGCNTLAGAMYRLGIFLGTDVKPPEDTTKPYYYEDHWLGEKCRNSFCEPWLTPCINKIDRTNLLRHWAGVQCQYKKEGANLFCGKHPILSLMGEELMEAWNNPKIIVVERPEREMFDVIQSKGWQDWHPHATTYALKRMEKAREDFLRDKTPEHIKFNYDEIFSQPEQTIEKLCQFLNHHASDEQTADAVTFIQTSTEDF